MSEVRAKLVEAELKLTEAMARFEALTDDPVIDSAARVSQLAERRSAITKQLEMLKGQQAAWSDIESKQFEVDRLRKRAELIDERLMRSELQQLRRSTTVDVVEKTLKALESQNPGATPDSDK